ncbi:MAG: PTS sugar transporter subunit IIC [Erysipelotrichaceae bacterium]|nr:PTS sugar transporter subunit IIC [Erysipelotrichaceae bacterium]
MGNILQAIIAALIAGICEWDVYGGFHTQICRPVVVGPLMGLALGDLSLGLTIGAGLEFVFLGVISVGAAIPPDATSATALATAVACVSNGAINANQAVTLGVALASVAQMLQMLIWTVNITWMHQADKSAAVGDIDGVCKWMYVSLPLWFLQGAIPAFLLVAFGQDLVAGIVLPGWLSDWLTLAGGMIGAVGFAMLFVLMNKPKLTPFFMIGFVLAAALGMGLVPTAVLGLAAALLYVNNEGGQAAPEKKRRSREA